MKRLLVVDDEQPVVDHISRLVDRELSAEFTVAGKASSGREALEKVGLVQPDIIVMDVRMPGLSGLDTIRELQRRGSGAAFVLSTAYERFDIAREALELGITGYLLKPVELGSLSRALRSAAAQRDRRTELEHNEFDSREKDRLVRGFVVEAFLGGLMLGQSSGASWQAQKNWLGVDKPYGLVAAAAFLHHPQHGRDTLEATLQYKTPALCGPLVNDRCAVFLPLASPEEAPDAEKGVLEAVRSALGDDLQRGALRLGFADVRPLDELARSWPEALGRLSGRKSPEPWSGGGFEDEEELGGALARGDPDRVRLSLEALLLPLEGMDEVDIADRYRIIALLGSAIGRLVGLGRFDAASARGWMDFDDLRHAAGGREFCLLARSRIPAIVEAVGRTRRWSVWLTGALNFLSQNFHRQVTLDMAAAAVGISSKRLSRLFVEELGQGFSDYLIDFRIDKSKVLLAVPGASVKQVAADCGYPDPNYFARLFKKVTGVTPREFAATR